MLPRWSVTPGPFANNTAGLLKIQTEIRSANAVEAD